MSAYSPAVDRDVEPYGLFTAVAGAVAVGSIGFNLSLKHKQTVIQLLNRLAPSAQLIGAVNCGQVTSDGLVGYRRNRGPSRRRVCDSSPRQTVRAP